MIVRVSRSPLRLLGYALVAVPMILLAVDMLVAYRFFPFPETTTASSTVTADDGSTTEVTWQVYTDNGKAQRRRDLAWGSALGLGGLGVIGWACAGLVAPRRLLTADAEGLTLRLEGGACPPLRLAWEEIAEVRSGLRRDQAGEVPVLSLRLHSPEKVPLRPCRGGGRPALAAPVRRRLGPAGPRGGGPGRGLRHRVPRLGELRVTAPARIGAHVPSIHPLEEAAERGADLVQVFLSNPQSWKKPAPRADAAALRAAPLPIVVHAPYLINVASPNNRVRIPSRTILADTLEAAAGVGAVAVVVHGGHVGDDEDPAVGVERWRKALEGVDRPVRVLLENTAGGGNAVLRDLGRLGPLWEAIGHLGVGVCLDTCHAWAAGEDLETAVDRVRAATGGDRPAALQRLPRSGGKRPRPARQPGPGPHPAGLAGRGGRRGGGSDRGGDTRRRRRPGSRHRLAAAAPGRRLSARLSARRRGSGGRRRGTPSPGRRPTGAPQ